MAGVTLVSSLCQPCRAHAAFGKASIGGFSSSSLARTFSDVDASQLLAQPALQLKSASSAECRSDPWDVSRQMALPLAYPGSHPHDTLSIFSFFSSFSFSAFFYYFCILAPN
jgi:hypothetical protein